MRKTKILWLIVVAVVAVVAVGVAVTGCGKKTRSTAYDVVKQNKMDNYTFLNRTAKHNEVVMIGDSIVEIFPTEMFDSKEYIVYNRGISGDNSDRTLARLRDNALNIEPRILSVLVGTNDLAPGLGIDFTIDNIAKIIDMAKEAKVPKIIIQSVYPVNRAINAGMVGHRNNADIEKLNTRLKALCEEQSVIFADIYPHLQDDKGNFNKGYTYDGLHPNVSGYTKIIEQLDLLFSED